MHHNYYVYTHTRLDTNEVFYVGMGKTPKANKVWQHYTKYSRAYEKTKRSSFWKNVVNKTSYIVSIIFESSILEDVKTKEIELIKLYGRKWKKEGTLVNFSAGGDYNDGPKNRHIQITQKKLDSTIVKIWPELKDIEIETGYLKTNIVKCCRKKQITAYGYIWEYTNNRQYDKIKSTAARKKNTNRRVGIELYNLEGVLLKTFTTQQETADYLKVHISTVNRYLHIYKPLYFTLKYSSWN